MTVRVFIWTVCGAIALGLIGLVGGFFGPLLLTPEANQGPLLGIFITGPLTTKVQRFRAFLNRWRHDAGLDPID